VSLAFAELERVGDRFYNAVTLVDLTVTGQPLRYVNSAFLALTGYEASEVIGRNCRFLQGHGTAATDVARLRAAIAAGRAIYCDLLNQRKNGQQFYNRLVLLPVTLDERPHILGMQIDASALVAPALAQGRTFDDWKTSEAIRDRITTPLMTITSVGRSGIDDSARLLIMERALDKIVRTVRAMPEI
jgi:PAS domain S-box-containing protein